MENLPKHVSFLFPRIQPGTAKLLVLLVVGLFATSTAIADETESPSYAGDVLPIFQAHCVGCHQPAKASGAYNMTSFANLLAGGDRGQAAVVPGKPDESLLVTLITPANGSAEMPMDGDPLSDEEIKRIRQWIASGAKDDSPTSSGPVIDAEHPPVYTQPPVVTSIDYSPDGSLIAVAGAHEVLLHNAGGSGLVGRLIGLSERIEQVRFSPNGKYLAVAGGDPGRCGEVQVWNVEDRELGLSVPLGFDTLRGISWSPDGRQVAFGCTDNTVRVIDAETGEQLLYQGSSNDWPLDTVYSVDGSHLVSVGRDMTAKLIEVETERFVDNITSITPGALKGGINSVARHPLRDEILFGGADGVPRIYRMHRQTKRVIGDDANLLFELPPLEGRIFSVDFSTDGTLIAAGSSLDGHGAVHVYRMAAEPKLPKNIEKLLFKPTHTRTAKETDLLKKHFADAVEVVAQIPVTDAAIYAVSVSPDGKTVAASGSGGRVCLIDTTKGEMTTVFDVVDDIALPSVVSSESVAEQQVVAAKLEEAPIPGDVNIKRLLVEPAELMLESQAAYAQIVVTAEMEDGQRFDVTRRAELKVDSSIANINSYGMLVAKAPGSASVSIRLDEAKAEVPLLVSGGGSGHADYIQDVNPVLARAGCNAGTCHGAKDGKNGFKLSLRGYDPIYDIRALTDDHSSRRVNLAAPDRSLMLLKAVAQVPHEGGQVIKPDSRYYRILKTWIEEGARLHSESPRVTSISVTPTNPVIEQINSLQQLRVVAYYADGNSRDVTGEAFIESGNTDVLVVEDEHPGLMRALRRGESAALVRYEGAYAATTLTVMGDREGFQWESPPANNRIDELVAAKLERTKTLASPLADEYEFVRRVHLDLTGLPPTPEAIQRFVSDPRESRVKRDELVEHLIGCEDYVEYWTNKWADLLQVNGKFLGSEGAAALRAWIRGEVEANTPYDEFVTKLLTATGSNRKNPPASYFKTLRTPEDTMENTTHLFLATRFNCNKCHDHPFEKWTQDQYYELAAFFAKVQLKGDPESGDKTIGATAVEAGKPLYEIVSDGGDSEMHHDRTGAVTQPAFPFECEHSEPLDATRRERLASWVTSPENPYFARSYVNRLWGYLLGTGIIEPIDDIRAGNPPSNPELLDYLTEEFIAHDFDARHVMKLICQSRTYQLSVASNQWNEDDRQNFSHAAARRLPAEVLYDAVYQVTGSTSSFPGIPAGTRAAALPDAGIKLPDGFLDTLGRPARESACECERVNELQLGPVMALVSGPTVGQAISDSKNEIAKLATSDLTDTEVVEQVYLRVINRPPTPDELDVVAAIIDQVQVDHDLLVRERDQYIEELSPRLAVREVARQQQVVRLEREVEARQMAIVPNRKRLERERGKRIAAAEAELKTYEDRLVASLPAWREELRAKSNLWRPIEFTKLETTIPGKLVVESDGAVFAEVGNSKGEYRIVGSSSLNRMTAVRLEALPDKRLPANGPGRSPKNGNFVLTEFSVAKFSSAEEAKTEVKLAAARADYSQSSYDVATAIDGRIAESGNGWAISPEGGKRHVAVFEFDKPLALEEGSQLEFLFQHMFKDGNHSLGRFRISVTDSELPASFGLPTDVEAILLTDPAKHTEEQAARLLAYRKEQDEKLKTLQQALAEAQQPVPEDATLADLQSQLAAAKQPIPVDAKLRQLEHDISLSSEQLENRRLTAVQDLVWALINSPAFLYNH